LLLIDELNSLKKVTRSQTPMYKQMFMISYNKCANINAMFAYRK